MPNEAQKVSKTAPRVSLTMKISPKSARERVPYPEHPRKLFFFSSTRVFRRSSTFRLPSASALNTFSHRKVSSHQNIFSSGLSVEYYLGVPEVDPNKKPRKNFFVKNDHAQYGREFFDFFSDSKNCIKKIINY